jgi:hypothetical protein
VFDTLLDFSPERCDGDHKNPVFLTAEHALIANSASTQPRAISLSSVHQKQSPAANTRASSQIWFLALVEFLHWPELARAADQHARHRGLINRRPYCLLDFLLAETHGLHQPRQRHGCHRRITLCRIDLDEDRYRPTNSASHQRLPSAALLASYDFLAEHRKHRRTTNIIESSFATVHPRTVHSKGCLSNKTALAMIFKRAEAAKRSWRRLDGHNELPKIIIGVRSAEGIESLDHKLNPLPPAPFRHQTAIAHAKRI